MIFGSDSKVDQDIESFELHTRSLIEQGHGGDRLKRT